MRVMEKSKTVVLKLEDRGSNDLFAACPIDTYPGPALGNLSYIYIYICPALVNFSVPRTLYLSCY